MGLNRSLEHFWWLSVFRMLCVSVYCKNRPLWRLYKFRLVIFLNVCRTLWNVLWVEINFFLQIKILFESLFFTVLSSENPKKMQYVIFLTKFETHFIFGNRFVNKIWIWLDLEITNLFFCQTKIETQRPSFNNKMRIEWFF